MSSGHGFGSRGDPTLLIARSAVEGRERSESSFSSSRNGAFAPPLHHRLRRRSPSPAKAGEDFGFQGAKRGGSASARMIENHSLSSVHSWITPQPAARSSRRLSRWPYLWLFSVWMVA